VRTCSFMSPLLTVASIMLLAPGTDEVGGTTRTPNREAPRSTPIQSPTVMAAITNTPAVFATLAVFTAQSALAPSSIPSPERIRMSSPTAPPNAGQLAPPVPAFCRIFDVDGPSGIECRTSIWNGEYELIVLATPSPVTSSYLDKFACCPGNLNIWAEKSWFPSVAEARRVHGKLKGSGHRVFYGDHYMHKAVCQNWLWQAPLELLLDGPVIAVEGVLFEEPAPLSPNMVAAGVLDDLLVHNMSLLRRLFHKPLTVQKAFAARQATWPGTSESYVLVNGVIITDRASVAVRLAAAKNYSVKQKQMILHGSKSLILVDFNEESAHLVTAGTRRRLYPEVDTARLERPYEFILRALIENRCETLGLQIHEVVDVLQALEDAKGFFPNPLPTY
jgi:predicted dehydrogenase